GVAPALVSITGFAVAGEVLSGVSALGICVITAGIVSLSLNSGKSRDVQRGVGYALATGLAIAGYSVVDGIGGRVAGTPLSYIGWLFLLHGIPLTAITCWRRGLPVVFGNRRVALTGIGGAALSMLAYGIVIDAMSRAPLGPVSALRETSVVFGALISAFALKEGLGRIAAIAALLVSGGVILLRLG
ncbi:MAG: EamA family transporter, partial [Pseudomonadales bacterium]|nr:EamA family transporter [Pseudomonadales bacterium]